MKFGGHICRLAGATNLPMFWTAFVLVFHVAGTLGAGRHNQTAGSSPSDAINRLSKLFGFSRIPARIFHRSPPQYMLELYSTLTDSGGLTKQSSPYGADVVRSFPDKDSVHKMHFHYDISRYNNSEQILESEFHIFKMRPKPSPSHEARPPHHIEIRVYQVLDINAMHTKQGLRLLDAKKLSAHVHGWLTFRVKKAVETWFNNSELNFGLLVTTTGGRGIHVNGSYIRFAQRHEHHESKQPILVIFTDDGRSRHPSYISPDDEGYMELKQDILQQERLQEIRSKHFRQAIRFLNERERAKMTSPQSAPFGSTTRRSHSRRTRRSTGSTKALQALGIHSVNLHRTKRSSGKKKSKGGRKKRTFDMNRYRIHRRTCSRQPMYVDFDEIGWSGWIISPKGYNAYHCTGECPFPLGQSQKPTNHATVQSIVHALRVGKDVGTPCCVPNKLYSISLLYFDDDENVILKQYDDMVAASCGCH